MVVAANIKLQLNSAIRFEACFTMVSHGWCGYLVQSLGLNPNQTFALWSSGIH